jgi:radical SAM superfamily enzyme YgiQ (UPF0313 family)
MPDVYPKWDTHVGQHASLGLASIAANCPDHEVYVGDLILKRKNVKKAVHNAIKKYSPDVIGLSAMTFQFPTAVKIARFIKEEHPSMPIVIGGYHASVLYKQIVTEDCSLYFDFIARGEGDLMFNELLNEYESGRQFGNLKGLSYKCDGVWVHNEPRPLEKLEDIRLPDRDSRIWRGYHIYGIPSDIIEASRGCLQHCRFCSIRHMYGQERREYPINRVIEDIKDARARGVRAVFFTDDNITSDVRGLRRFEELLDAIIENNLNDISYMTQASSMGMGADEKVVQKMKKAGFAFVFLGLENVSQRNLALYRKGNIVESTRNAIRYLNKHGIFIIGGLVLGAEDDTEEDIRINFDLLIDSKVDGILAQILTPYPGTELRDDLLKNYLITNENNWETYHGHYANIRSKYLSSDQLNYLLWKHSMRYYRSRMLHLFQSDWFKEHPVSSLKMAFKLVMANSLDALKGIFMDEREKYELALKKILNFNRNLI